MGIQHLHVYMFGFVPACDNGLLSALSVWVLFVALTCSSVLLGCTPGCMSCAITHVCVASMPLSPLEGGGPGAYTSPKLQARVLDALWYVFWDIMCVWSSRATVGTHSNKCTTYAYYSRTR